MSGANAYVFKIVRSTSYETMVLWISMADPEATLLMSLIITRAIKDSYQKKQ